MERSWNTCKNYIRLTASGATIICGDNICEECADYEIDIEKLEKYEQQRIEGKGW